MNSPEKKAIPSDHTLAAHTTLLAVLKANYI